MKRQVPRIRIRSLPGLRGKSHEIGPDFSFVHNVVAFISVWTQDFKYVLWEGNSNLALSTKTQLQKLRLCTECKGQEKPSPLNNHIAMLKSRTRFLDFYVTSVLLKLCHSKSKIVSFIERNLLVFNGTIYSKVPGSIHIWTTPIGLPPF